eukprot:TRINITY_DN1458_c1_g3_i1.p9 TRINITY_DN1458_c1_g3~~TRINITY_DN1458_c1_g3_i1.p9  ORF type:complete len:154 (-),score=26.81 TRINITY_DN1458_c1_g3_i1:2997-3458(-)
MSGTEEAVSRRKPVFGSVSDLKPDTHGHNLIVKVASESSQVVNKPRRSDGMLITISEALVGDKTGAVLLSAKNEQQQFLVKGKYLTIRNAKVDIVQNRIRLVVDQWGKIEFNEEVTEKFEANEEVNVSAVEYELKNVTDTETHEQENANDTKA